MQKHAEKVSRSIENAKAVIEALSFAADGPHQITGDMIDRVTRAALAELKRAQEALDKMPDPSEIKAAA